MEDILKTQPGNWLVKTENSEIFYMTPQGEYKPSKYEQNTRRPNSNTEWEFGLKTFGEQPFKPDANMRKKIESALKQRNLFLGIKPVVQVLENIQPGNFSKVPGFSNLQKSFE